MCKLWLALVLVLCFVPPIYAVELTIYDAVVSNLDISLTASLSANSNYYLQGLLRSQASSKYFGETQGQRGEWIDYLSSPDKEYITSNFFITDLQNASWSGQLKLRYKIDDPNYFGPGIYELKLRRFTGASSSSAGESNTLLINLQVSLPTPTPTPTPSPSPPPPSPAPALTSSPIPPSTPRLTPSPSPIGEIAGLSDTQIDLSGFGMTASPSSTTLSTSFPPQLGQQRPKLDPTRAKTVLLLGSGIFIISLAGFFGYRHYLFRKRSDL